MNEFLQAFILVFVAEMGDKSQLLSLAFATKYKLQTVMLGIAIGIGLNHGLAILLGSLISEFLDLQYIKFFASVIFILFGLSSLKIDFDEDEEERRFKDLGPTFTIAGTFFLGELGDKTQIIAMTMGAVSENKFVIFLATFSSMMLVSLIGIMVGRFLKKKIPEVTMNIIASGLFLFFGLAGMYNSFKEFGISYLYLGIVAAFLILAIILIVKRNEKEKDKHYIFEIKRNLENCVGCDKPFCNCETKKNIDNLTEGYLGENIKYIGNLINYLEDFKKISPDKYMKLYEEIKKDGVYERIVDSGR